MVEVRSVFNAFSDFDVYVSAGALITLSPSFKFKPSAFLDYSVQKTKKTQLDLNGKFYNQRYGVDRWFLAHFRTSCKLVILQLQVNPQLMIGYSYDYPVGMMNTYSKGSHEIILRYEIQL